MSETATPVVESPKPSKLERIKANACVTGIALIPIALTGASMYVFTRTSLVNLETAKLNLATAKLNHKS